ncbi:hypothetical protein [Laceyella putida]|uniref:Uncharacterized protein n=1 Tax=Laceyella putida TaxID=110101 RepID=A0ABW2RNT4_9BACL
MTLGTWFCDVRPEQAPALIEWVRTGGGYDEHVSHVYEQERFVRKGRAPIGVKK